MCLNHLGVFVEIALIVGSEERDRALQGFNVDPSAAARTVVYQEMGEFLKKSIPKTIHSRDMLDLGNAAAVFGIVLSEEGISVVFVKILSVTRKVKLVYIFFDHTVNMLQCVLASVIQEVGRIVFKL